VRRTKASFDEAFWNADARAVAAEWTGEGVDPELVDVAALRELWGAPEPDARTFTLLQAVWLASGAREPEQAVDGRVERVPAVGAAQLPGRERREVDEHLRAGGRQPDAALVEQPGEPLRGA
jgi:hypothetical protein